MRIKRRSFLTISVMTLSLLGNLANGYADNGRLRWDIITLTIGSTITIDPGGHASARTNDASRMTLTGSSTFRASGQSQNVTGGGLWETRDPDSNVTGAGTYDVRKVGALI